MNIGNQKNSAEIISIMSRNTEIAYRFYKTKFDNAFEEYRVWQKNCGSEKYAGVIEWRSLLEGEELRQKAEMWFRVCARLKQHIQEKRTAGL